MTFTATDDCGNASTTSATFTIEDTTDPVLTNDPMITIPCDEYPDDIIYASASDDCGGTTITFSDVQVSGGCLLPVGAYLRTYTATDDCGNTSTSEQIVTLIDDTAPVITVPADYTTTADALDCSADISSSAAGMASATDNCDADVEITYVDGDWSYTCTGDDDTTEGTRTLTRTWTATDDCGNSSSGTQSITVTDETAPVGSTEDASVPCADMTLLQSTVLIPSLITVIQTLLFLGLTLRLSILKELDVTKFYVLTPSLTIVGIHLLQTKSLLFSTMSLQYSMLITTT